MQQPFSVLSWNVLAHIHTTYNAVAHQQGDRARESEAQRVARRAASLRRLQQLAPDLALLQEVDAFFAPPPGEILPGCGCPSTVRASTNRQPHASPQLPRRARAAALDQGGHDGAGERARV